MSENAPKPVQAIHGSDASVTIPVACSAENLERVRGWARMRGIDIDDGVAIGALALAALDAQAVDPELLEAAA